MASYDQVAVDVGSERRGSPSRRTEVAARMTNTEIFFAYAGQPEATRETVANAAACLADRTDVSPVTWEGLRVAGRLIIGQITSAINSAGLVCAEVSSLNPNVLFELGYAVARDKPIRILLDSTDADAVRLFKQFGLLNQVGFLGYANSLDIRSRLLGSLQGSMPSLWEDLLATTASVSVEHSIFYYPLNHATEASRTLSRRLEAARRSGWEIFSADHSEVSLAPLSWYVQQVFKTDASVFHLAAPRRANSTVHNARTSFLAGVAHGLGRDMLMLAEEDYIAPFDYADLLQHYSSSKTMAAHFQAWMSTFEAGHAELKAVTAQMQAGKRRLTSQLGALNFYEYVAEQEAGSLTDYFVRTRKFEDLLKSPAVIFVGRKGVGKTANMLEAAQTLSEDRRNLVVVIKPADYELRGLVKVLQDYRGKESLSYLTDNMWKFLLYSEIARVAVEEAECKPAGVAPGSNLDDLKRFLEDSGFPLREDFSVRLERLVTALLTTSERVSRGVADARDAIGAALGGVLLRDLRSRLERSVTQYTRVAVLVDNLDKAWDRQADLDDLASLLLGLLTAVGRVANEFPQSREKRSNELSFSLGVFLRSDVHQHVLSVAREPDKISTASVTWDDVDLLFRVVEERYIFSGAGGGDLTKLWTEFFCPTVDGLTVRDYIARIILPRPRDLLYFVNSAVESAVNAARQRVEAEDLRRAESQYSQFAFEAALVPNGITTVQLEALLFEFAGGPSVLTDDDIASACRTAGITGEPSDGVVRHLLSVEFLGWRTGEGRASYGAEGADARKARVLARKHATSAGGEVSYQIHPAFWSNLEIDRRQATERAAGA